MTNEDRWINFFIFGGKMPEFGGSEISEKVVAEMMATDVDKELADMGADNEAL